MIGFNALGQLGRLGNQMFQFASLMGIAKINDHEFCIPPSDWESDNFDSDEYYRLLGSATPVSHQLFQVFDLLHRNPDAFKVQYIDPAKPVYNEGGFQFDEKLYNTCPDEVDLRGFFQSYRYFDDFRSELTDLFRFKDEFQTPCKELIDQFDEPPLSIHVRRGDYLTNPNHSTLSLKYYEDALAIIGDPRKMVFVFSDDPQWCRQQEVFSGDRFLISENNSTYMDLCLMTMCSGHITANSSFSWWGAYLSKSNVIVSPRNWFVGSQNEGIDTKDLLPPDWVSVNNVE